MRVQLTQTTVKYFIITAVSATTLTVYGGTDYTLANAAISAISFSPWKAPFGFPLDPTKWTVKVTDSTTDRTVLTPTANTWYNISQLGITLPIGIWKVSARATILSRSTGSEAANVFICLSTNNNSSSDKEMLGTVSIIAPESTVFSKLEISNSVFFSKDLVISTKTPYYCNIETTNGSISLIAVIYTGSVLESVVQAVSSYL
jgi:hypothetical protein